MCYISSVSAHFMGKKVFENWSHRRRVDVLSVCGFLLSTIQKDFLSDCLKTIETEKPLGSVFAISAQIR